MKVIGWILLAIGGLLLFAVNPIVAAGVSMVILGAALLGYL